MPAPGHSENPYAVVEEDRIVEALVCTAWPFAARGDRSGAFREARAALESWVAQGLPFRRQGNQRFFDLLYRDQVRVYRQG